MCNGVSGNGNACAQAARHEPKMCTRFAIGLIPQLPHLSNLLLCYELQCTFQITTVKKKTDEMIKDLKLSQTLQQLNGIVIRVVRD